MNRTRAERSEECFFSSSWRCWRSLPSASASQSTGCSSSQRSWLSSGSSPCSQAESDPGPARGAGDPAASFGRGGGSSLRPFLFVGPPPRYLSRTAHCRGGAICRCSEDRAARHVTWADPALDRGALRARGESPQVDLVGALVLPEVRPEAQELRLRRHEVG